MEINSIFSIIKKDFIYKYIIYLNCQYKNNTDGVSSM